MAGMALLVPAMVMKTPTYWAQGLWAKPMMGRPVRETRLRKMTTGPRVLYCFGCVSGWMGDGGLGGWDSGGGV